MAALPFFAPTYFPTSYFYPPLLGPFNLFHFLMIGLLLYGLAWLARDDPRPAAAGVADPV